MKDRRPGTQGQFMTRPLTYLKNRNAAQTAIRFLCLLSVLRLFFCVSLPRAVIGILPGLGIRHG
ncbi:MAG: hypothetical protein LKK18_01185 [Clostridiales bacterium]|jgi:hypothetical protein|nr:hypothetical protein [Clostridiales bacterium]